MLELLLGEELRLLIGGLPRIAVAARDVGLGITVRVAVSEAGGWEHVSKGWIVLWWGWWNRCYCSVLYANEGCRSGGEWLLVALG